MSFDLENHGGWGSSANDTTLSVINSTTVFVGLGDVSTTSQTDTAFVVSNTTGFSVGDEVLIHASICSTTSPSAEALARLGEFFVAKIKSFGTYMQSPTIVVDKSFLKHQDLRYQMVKILSYHDFTLDSGGVRTVEAYDASTRCGGILALKINGTLKLNGGHIDLSGKGIPTSAAAYRPLTAQEQSGTLDTDRQSGEENFCNGILPLNVGDGALFLMAKNISVVNSASRIGNPTTQGVQYCRGASDSADTPSGVSNIGGSSILIAAKSIGNFNPAIIAKYRTPGTGDKGLARCYIAVNPPNATGIKSDEGLYALDALHDDANRPKSSCNLCDFGKGSNGSTVSATGQLNGYIPIATIDSTRTKLSGFGNLRSQDGVAQFKKGALVMIHLMNKKPTTNKNFEGLFWLARLTSAQITNLRSELEIDSALPFNLPSDWQQKYYLQAISIPEFTDFSCNNSATPKWTEQNGYGYGGICAIACSGTCDLRGKKILVEDKGTDLNNVNEYSGNAFMATRLPIGAGHGSVFIIADTLKMNEQTRIGASYTGANYGGYAADQSKQSGYAGKNATYNGGYQLGGSGKAGGVYSSINGGWHSNSSDGAGKQGAHIWIAANTITGFTLAAISTGGSSPVSVNYSGGAGYGGCGNSSAGIAYHGNGGFQGGGAGRDNGGGAAGAAFIYCNNH